MCGWVNKSTAALLTAVLLFCAACGSEPSGTDTPAAVLPVTQPDYIATAGWITYRTFPEEEENIYDYESVYGTVRIQLPDILSQIADTAVRKRAEKLIRTACEELADRPDPTGRLAPEPQPLVKENCLVTADCLFSAGDFLSLSLHRFYSIRSMAYSLSDTGGVNLDLRSGKTVPLSEIFTEGFDYRGWISDRISLKLLNEGVANDDPRISRSFSGIAEDQAYYFNQIANLVLCVGGASAYYEASDYYWDGTYELTYKEICPYLTVFERFYAQRPLYAPVSYMLLPKQSFAVKQSNCAYPQTEKLVFEYFYNSVKTPVDAPDWLSEAVRQENRQPLLEELLALDQTLKEESCTSYYHRFSADEFGSCIFVRRTESVNMEPQRKGWKQDVCRAFDRQTGRELTREEWFVPGYDGAELFFDKFRLSVMAQVGSIIGTDEQLAAHFADAQWAVEDTGIHVTVNGPWNDVVENAENRPVDFLVGYGQIGIENLSFVTVPRP